MGLPSPIIGSPPIRNLKKPRVPPSLGLLLYRRNKDDQLAKRMLARRPFYFLRALRGIRLVPMLSLSDARLLVLE